MSLYGFTWILEGCLAGMPRPEESIGQLDELKGRGIGALVNLTCPDWPRELIQQSGLAYLHLPIPDFAPPQPGQVDAFIEFCEANIAAGRAVAVHCIAGRGRTGAMAACFLVHRGLPPQQAVDYVRSVRPGAIETVGQEEAVFGYAARRATSGP